MYYSLLILCFIEFFPGTNCVRWGPPSNESLFNAVQSVSNIQHVGNTTTLSPNGQIMNVHVDSLSVAKVRPIRAKNRTFESIRDIIDIDQDYPDDKYDYNDKMMPGIDSNGNLNMNMINKNISLNGNKINDNVSNDIDGSDGPNTATSSPLSSPSPVALPHVSEMGHHYYPNKPSDCPHIPSPTLTPSLPSRPRYVKIEWRKMILPPSAASAGASPSSSALSSSSTSSSLSSSTLPSSHKVELVIPNDFSPFYYRKLVDYGPNPSGTTHPSLIPIGHHPSSLPPPPIPIPVKRNKKPNQLKFPNMFAGFMRSKKKRPKTKRPGYVYISGPPEPLYPPPPPSSYYYGPVTLPEREPWPVESVLKLSRNLHSFGNIGTNDTLSRRI